MKLDDKLYCDICHKRVDNFVDPTDLTIYYGENNERHYCKEHCNIGELKLYEILKDTKYTEILKDTVEKTLHKDKIKRIYEDDDFIIDLFPADQAVRVSIFKDGHYQDEVMIRKEDYLS